MPIEKREPQDEEGAAHEPTRADERRYTAQDVRELMRRAWREGWASPQHGNLGELRHADVSRLLLEFEADHD